MIPWNSDTYDTKSISGLDLLSALPLSWHRVEGLIVCCACTYNFLIEALEFSYSTTDSEMYVIRHKKWNHHSGYFFKCMSAGQLPRAWRLQRTMLLQRVSCKECWFVHRYVSRKILEFHLPVFQSFALEHSLCSLSMYVLVFVMYASNCCTLPVYVCI